jgi:N-acylglucosamine-6-phosphate 2-epimerase
MMLHLKTHSPYTYPMKNHSDPRFATLAQLDAAVRGRLVVSCQPVDNGPLDVDSVVPLLAKAAQIGGAGAIRIEGANRVRLTRAAIDVPIIGIIKRDLNDSPVRITPYLADVEALADAGAHIIAVDATDRTRPETVANLLAAIQARGAWAMADCANLGDATRAHEMGFTILGTTLSGYTGGTIPDEPDYAFLAALAKIAPRVMAEGRFNTPAQVEHAAALGAWAVTVGTAITRTEVLTSWFAAALKAPQEK